MRHDFPFDPRYGHDIDALLKVGLPEEPEGFEAFWRDLYRQTLRVPPNVTRLEVPTNRPGVKVYEIEYDSLDGFRVGGWLTVPADGVIRRGMVVGHGYGGRSEPDFGPRQAQTAAIFPCGRGFDRSARPDLPSVASDHVVFGIESRDTYIHGRCAADLWAALTALLSLFPHLAGVVDYAGTSFGGGMGALAVPWDARLRRAFLDVPSFGNHPLRLTMECVGSGEFVRRYFRLHPEVTKVLAYFDAATAARHITIPTFVAAAAFDPAVPPPGQFAVYNAIPGPKRLFVRQTGHFPNPNEAAEDEVITQALQEWFAV
jgi:cephalosporin-C deacetylase